MGLAGVALLASGATTWADDRINLKVLYAGNPGSDREKDFTSLLERHFTRVAAMSYEAFKERDAKDHDVVILDWTSIYPRDEHGAIAKEFTSLKSPKAPKLSGSYDRPTILIGAAGISAVRPLKLKLDWL
jgi:hypothetical protein